MSSTNLIRDLRDARVGIVGLGRTGLAVIDVLATYGARVSAFDAREEALEALDVRRSGPVVEARAGNDEQVARAVTEADLRLLIVSPGVAATGPVMAAAAAVGIETWSEIELAWRLQQATRPQVPWITVTGTDGKTTTVGMLSSMLGAAGLEAPAVGNIGLPAISVVAEGRSDVLAVELSSFQLHTTRTLSPLAASCLNVAADHLDWHGGQDAYTADKARVYARARRAAVYNLADAATLAMVEQADVVEGCRAIGFGLAVPGLGQLGLVEDVLIDRGWHDDRRSHGLELATLADLAHLAPGGDVGRLPAHVVADALAAAALAMSHDAVQAGPEAVARGLRAYTPGAHRLVTVAQADGVTWVDDSKATNTHSARAALTGLPEGSAVWLVGGDTKGADLHELVTRVRSRLRAAVVLGREQEAVVAALRDGAPDLPLVQVPDGEGAAVIDAAVRAAASLAHPGDTVILAPAAASWDQFRSYAERGDLFAAAAQRLADEGTRQ
ncbi:UDP-N-acetylmuramoyl-L-alanine--D-glutamate ligase [Actinomyces respiraculi]|uniref:UDP-N-acetylmuramoyl-L-alanine--D-glutamate ligase n=1 Tax=Actinomyces respiraculi TaxID=2744574 RepID=UPI001F433378|nr:UDP-N-acetylmuramoyl-L-alanine--D-glutamate ligase [Actinomyces respiraculi]